MTNLAKAITYATLKHDGQTRRDGSPYIYHPLGMAQALKEKGYDETVQIVALLHDTLEDTAATKEEILEFGEDVLEAVKLLTRPKGADEEIYLDNILKNELARIVKEADKLYNMQDLLTCDDEKFVAKYVQKSQKYYYGKFSKEVDNAIDAAAKYLEDMTAEYWIVELCGMKDKKMLLKVQGKKNYFLKESGWEPTKYSPWNDEYGEYQTPVAYNKLADYGFYI